jgi:hypothetical protein
MEIPIKTLALAAFASLVAVPAVATPIALAPLEAGLVTIGYRAAVVYCAVRAEGYEVVVTLW